MIKLFSEEEFDKCKSNDVLPLQCENCNNVFYVSKKLIKFEDTHKRNRCRFCSQACKADYYNNQVIVNCKNCGKEKKISRREYENSTTKNFFCDHHCAASYNNSLRLHSQETKDKIAAKLKETLSNKGYKLRTCKFCGSVYTLDKDAYPTCTKMFCCKECSKSHKKQTHLSEEYRSKLSIAGRKSVASQRDLKRSKNEKLFCEMCEKHFQEVKHNEPIFNGWDADVILSNEKIAILWNGKWHYEQISKNSSLKQIQNRDKIKIEEIEKLGYTPYIVKDMGKFDPKFVEDEFTKMLKFFNKN